MGIRKVRTALGAASVVVFLFGALAAPAHAQTFTVTTTADSGPGSLREAIAAVNAGTATIIDMTGLAGNITLVTPLPVIANPVTVNGAGPGLTIDGGGLGEVLLDAGADATFDTIVVDDDVTKEGAGMLTVTGMSRLAGAVSVNEGTLALGGAATGIEYLFVDVGAQVTLLDSQTVGDIELSDASLLDLQANTLTIDGSGGFGSSVSGTIAGAGGGLHLSGVAFALFGFGPGLGQGTYTGTTRASGDAFLSVFGDQVISAQSGLLLEDSAFVEIDGANTFASLSGTGGELFLCNCTNVTVDQDIDTTFSGALSGDAGSTFTKAGSGRLALTGDTSLFMGGMEVSGGVLEGTTTSLTFDILNNATVEFNQAFDGTYAGEMSGSGALVKSGAGTVILDGVNTYTGATTVTGGTLAAVSDFTLSEDSAVVLQSGTTLDITDTDQEIGSLAGAGAVALGDLGVLSAGGDDSDTTFSGVISGGDDAQFYKVGTGTMTLSGANAFAGVGYVDVGGTLRFEAGQTMRDLVVNAGGIIDIGGNALTLDGGSLASVVFGTISGNGGSLHVTGDAQVAFLDFVGEGRGTYTGTTTVSGDGMLLLIGDQSLSTQTSLIINENGFLQIDGAHTFAGLSGDGGEVLLCDCTALTIDQAGDSTFAGILSGDPDSAFTKAGAGRLLLTGDGSMFFGTMAVSGGILAGTTTSLLGDITNNAAVEFDQAFDGAFGATISGTGSVIKSGTGTVELTSANTYIGGTTVNAGTLVADEDGALGAGALTVNGGLVAIGGSNVVDVDVTALSGSGGAIEIAEFSTLIVDQASDTTFGGALSGDGILQKLGSGTLSFDGAALNGASVQVTEGVLMLASENVLAGTDGLLADGGHVTLGANQTADDFAAQIDGASSIDLGANSLTLGGSSGVIVMGTMAGAGGSLHVRGDTQLIFFLGGQGTYTGTTTVSGNGELYLEDQSLSAQSALVVNDNGYVDFGGAQTVRSLSGTGGELFFCVCGSLTVDQDIDTTFAGAITSDVGAGSLVKDGIGRLLLTGTNTYDGGTTVAGGILAGSTASLQGAIVNNATVEFAQTGSGTFDGLISGTGALVKSGAGSVSLTTANTYTGGTTLDAGTLIVEASGGMGSGALTVNAGLLDLNASHTATALAGTGGTVDIFTAGVLTIDQAVATTFAGSLTGGGALSKSGAGSLTLTGANSYSGGTTVLAGTLAGNSDSLQGAILNNATVRFAQGADGTFAGAITGAGGVVKSGSGTLFVTGGFDHTGGTSVLGGTLSGSAADLGGDIVNHAIVDFVETGSESFDGTISGTGQVIKSGGGTLALDGAHTYSGGTAINGGTLIAGSDASLGHASGGLTFNGGTLAIAADFASARQISLAGDGTFDTGVFMASLAGSISGAGALTKDGAGTLFLLGTTSHTGGTHVLEGVLVGDTSNLRGSISNAGALVFDQVPDGVFGGQITGDGSLFKVGAGTLLMGSAQAYTGPTVVQEGTLLVNGLGGDVLVFSGAEFGGTGFVDGTLIVDGTLSGSGVPDGILVGGASMGPAIAAGAGATSPLHVGGDLLLSDLATYEARVAADASIATLVVDGEAVLVGATLHLIQSPSGFDVAARREMSTVLTASEITGGFGAVTGLADTFDPYLFASGGSLNLLLVRNDIDFSAFGATANGSGVGAALASAQAGAEGDLAFVVRELSALATDAELSTALDRIAGAAHASFAGLSMIGSADVIDVLTTRFTTRGGWWAQGLGSSLSLDADLDPGASSATTRGLMAGYDRRWTRAMAGVAGGYHDSDIDASGGLDRIDGRAYRGAVYGAFRPGRMVFDGIVSAASHRVRGSRGISFAATLDPEFGGGLLFGGVDRAAAFAYRAVEAAVVADAGYVIDIAGFALQPSIGAQFTRISRDGFTESGAGALDLTAASRGTSSLAGRARLSIERRFERASGRWFAPRAGVRYTRELRDRDVPFTASIAGTPFTASGFALPQSLFAARAGVAAGFGAVTFSVDYRAALAAGHRHHLISAGFGF